MTDSPEPDPLAFTPVPARARSDGWTPGVGSGTSAYKLRERPGTESFARAWDIAQNIAGGMAFDQAIDRALNGVEVPRFYKGRQVATVRRPDYRLVLKVLDHHFARRAPTCHFATALAQLTDEPGSCE